MSGYKVVAKDVFPKSLFLLFGVINSYTFSRCTVYV